MFESNPVRVQSFTVLSCARELYRVVKYDTLYGISHEIRVLSVNTDENPLDLHRSRCTGYYKITLIVIDSSIVGSN